MRGREHRHIGGLHDAETVDAETAFAFGRHQGDGVTDLDVLQIAKEGIPMRGHADVAMSTRPGGTGDPAGALRERRVTGPLADENFHAEPMDAQQAKAIGAGFRSDGHGSTRRLLGLRQLPRISDSILPLAIFAPEVLGRRKEDQTRTDRREKERERSSHSDP